MRVVVDTSVWSLALRRQRKDLAAAQRALALLLRDLIVSGEAIVLGTVRQELLTGATASALFESIRDQLRNFDDLPPEIDDYERAAAYANDCINGGIAATPADMLICAMAAGRDLPILTTDADFTRYATKLPIRLYPHP